METALKIVKVVVKEYKNIQKQQIAIRKEILFLNNKIAANLEKDDDVTNKLTKLELRMSSNCIFGDSVDIVFKYVESNSKVEERDYKLFRYYLLEKPNQTAASSQFGLTQSPGGNRIRHCAKISASYWLELQKQPLGLSLTTYPMAVTKIAG